MPAVRRMTLMPSGISIVQRLARQVAIIANDAARNAAGTGLVWLQDDEASGQADKGGQGGALVAALFLVDLDDNILTFFQDVSDIGFAGFDLLDEVLAGNFLQRQEAVAISAEVYECRFEAGLDAGNLSFVNIGFFAFACG